MRASIPRSIIAFLLLILGLVPSQIASANPNALFLIDGTSETATSDTPDGSSGNPRPVAIGEIGTYRVEALLPESTTISFEVIASVVSGLEFVTGSARVSYQADTSPSFNGDFVGISNQLNPTFPFPAGRVNFDGGARKLSFDFDAIINNDGDAGEEFLIIEFDVVVPDILANMTGVTLTNDYDILIDEGLPTEVIVNSDALSVLVVEPVLNTTATYSPDTRVRGASTTFTVVVSNLATDGATGPLQDVIVTHVFDDSLDVTGVNVAFNAAATTFGSEFTNNSLLNAGFSAGVTDNLNVHVSGLPVDGVATLTIGVAIDPNFDPLLLSSTITSAVSVSADSLASDITPDDEDRGYSDSASDDLNIVKPPLLATLVENSDPVAAGAEIIYTFSVSNITTPPLAATDVEMVMIVPAGFVVTEAASPIGSCETVSPTMVICSGGSIFFGDLAMMILRGYYSSSTASGTIGNVIGYVTSAEGNHGNDGNDTPSDGDDERAEEPTTILRQVDVGVSKTVDDLQPVEGQIITFTLEVGNNGPSDASNVIVTDSIPAGLTFVQFLPVGLPCVYAAPTVTCTLSALSAGSTETINLQASVDAGTFGGSPISNVASVTTTEPETNLGNNSDDVMITVIQVTELLSNSGFEIAGNNPKRAAGWVLSDITTTSASRVCKNAFEGACAFRIKQTAAPIGVNKAKITQTILSPAVTTGDSISFAAHVKANALFNQGSIIVRAVYADGSTQHFTVTILGGTYAYTEVTGSMVLTGTPTKLLVILRPNRAIGTFFLDGLTLQSTSGVR